MGIFPSRDEIFYITPVPSGSFLLGLNLTKGLQEKYEIRAG